MSLDVGGVLTADQMPAVKAGAVEPAQERADGALRDVATPLASARPRGGRRSARTAHRRSARRSRSPSGSGSRTDAGKSGIVLGVTLELMLDAGDEVGDLAALVALLGEQEPQQPILDDIADRPEVRRHPGLAATRGQGPPLPSRA